MKKYARIAGKVAGGVFVFWLVASVLALLPDALAGALVLAVVMVGCYVYGVRVGLRAGKAHADAQWGSRAEALGL